MILVDAPNIAVFRAIQIKSLFKGIGLAPSYASVCVRDRASAAKAQEVGHHSPHISNQYGHARANLFHRNQ